MAAELISATLASFIAAFLLAPTAGAQPGHALAALLFVGSSVHVASTAGLFSFPAVRAHALTNRRRYVIAPLLLCATGAAVAALMTSHELVVLLLGYFSWQFFHYQKQNFGLAALIARTNRVSAPTVVERRSLIASGLVGIAGLLTNPRLLQLPISGVAGGRGGWLFGTIAALFAVNTAIGAVALLQRPRTQRPVSFLTMYLLGLVFPAPIFGFASPYQAVAGMTIAHGLQYLLLVSRVVAGPSPRTTSRVAGLLAGVAALGLGLNLASHLHNGGVVARVGYGVYLGLVMSHFVVDAGLWRMRDAFPRQFLSERLPAIATIQPAGGLP